MGRTDDGFTLVEVLVTVVITGIIAGAVTASIIIGLRTTDATVNRLSDSRDAQLAAAYFGTDVQEAHEVLIAPGDASCAPDKDRILDLLGPPDSSGPRYAVSYISVVREPATTVRPEARELRRLSCTVAGVDVAGRTDVVVADYLANPPVVSCPQGCSTETRQVRLTVSALGCSAVASCREEIDRQAYEYTLVGTRRSA